MLNELKFLYIVLISRFCYVDHFLECGKRNSQVSAVFFWFVAFETDYFVHFFWKYRFALQKMHFCNLTKLLEIKLFNGNFEIWGRILYAVWEWVLLRRIKKFVEHFRGMESLEREEFEAKIQILPLVMLLLRLPSHHAIWEETKTKVQIKVVQQSKPLQMNQLKFSLTNLNTKRSFLLVSKNGQTN